MPIRGLHRTVFAARWRARAVLALLGLGSVSLACRAPAPGAPDLALDWADASGRAPLEGSPGEEVVLGFALANHGSSAPYGATVFPTVTPGPVLGPVRFVPAPAPGERLHGATHFMLIEGQTEICLEARVVRRVRADVVEEALDDNRICRRIRLGPGGGAARSEPGAGDGEGPGRRRTPNRRARSTRSIPRRSAQDSPSCSESLNIHL